jgi:hypothetical protein
MSASADNLSVHVRFKKDNAKFLYKEIAKKRKKENRSVSNCIEVILLEYFRELNRPQ